MSATTHSSGAPRCFGASFKPLLSLPKSTFMKKAKLMYVNVADEILNSTSTCIILNTNAVSFKNFGRLASIVEKYPYADVAGRRQPSETIDFYARKEDIGVEGEAVVSTPPVYSEGPTVITLVSQFGIGRPINENKIAKKMSEKCPDSEIRKKLKADTEVNRISYFKDCIQNAKSKLEKMNDVKKIVIPVGISRSGNADPCWLCEYLPSIHELANEMNKLKKEVIIAASETYMNSLAEEYEKKKPVLKSAFDEFKSLQVLKEEDFDLDATVEYQVLNIADEDDEDSIVLPDIRKYLNNFHE